VGADELTSHSGALADGTTQVADGVGQLDNGMLKLAAGQEELSDGAARLDDGIATFGPDRLAVPVAVGLALLTLAMAAARLARSARARHTAA
jgi:X-X-X-Leu-X-X-Gly heptad repeat protein